MAIYTDWAGPHPKSRRKSDKYMPWDAFPYEPERRSNRGAVVRRTSSGTEAFDRAVRAAFRGKNDDAEIACLRGTLRKSVINLANAMRVAGLSEEKRRLAANQFREALRGYSIIAEKKDTAVVWRARLPLSNVWVEGGIYPIVS